MAAVAMFATANAKTKKVSFPVKGVCSAMCKPRIEKAAKSNKGVLSAKWNVNNKQLTMVYDDSKTSPAKVQRAIALQGHDAGSIKATAAAYKKLPGCCKYRDASVKKH